MRHIDKIRTQYHYPYLIMIPRGQKDCKGNEKKIAICRKKLYDSNKAFLVAEQKRGGITLL